MWYCHVESLLNLLESSQQLETVASAINQYFSAAALEERVYQLEQSQKEILLEREGGTPGREGGTPETKNDGKGN